MNILEKLDTFLNEKVSKIKGWELASQDELEVWYTKKITTDIIATIIIYDIDDFTDNKTVTINFNVQDDGGNEADTLIDKDFECKNGEKGFPQLLKKLEKMAKSKR